MLDTTPVTAEITKLITTGTTEQALLTAVAQLSRTCRRRSSARPLQVATAAAERRVLRPH
jgi:hypothetical protein